MKVNADPVRGAEQGHAAAKETRVEEVDSIAHTRLLGVGINPRLPVIAMESRTRKGKGRKLVCNLHISEA